MAGIQKSHTTPYHPMGNGIVERYNRTLGNMIRALPPQSKARWPQMLQMLTFCYNCTEHETTGFAPFFLIFGRIPRLPVDVVFQHVLPDGAVVDHSDFVAHLKRDLSEAARIARQNSRIAQARQAKNYDRKAKGAPLSVGDRVLLANRGERGKRKIADKWESTVFEVASVKPDINVYHIRDPVSLREKVVHRNLLLPVSFLPAEIECLPVSTCPSVADSGQGEPELPGDVQDGETKTVRWLMQMDQASDRDSAVGQTGCSLDVALSIPNSEAGSTVAPPAVCDPVVSKLPSPAPSVECVVSRSVSSQLLAEDAQHVLSPDLVTDTRLSTEGHVVRTQPPPLCTRSGRPVKPPTRLICEMNEQHVDDSVSTVDSLFSFVRNMFSG
ncbi:hypothetical protein ACER0C_002461 [Sarotherodon galilaeus]